MYINYAHGLLGRKSFPYRPGLFTGGTLRAVQAAASQEKAGVNTPHYQPDSLHENEQEAARFPTLSEMGALFAREVDSPSPRAMQEDPERDLWVGSSVGAAVMLQAMLHSRSVTDMILYKPIYDIFAAMAAFAHATGAMEQLAAAQAGHGVWEMPVAPTEIGGDAGTFPVSAHHINDDYALQILSNRRNSMVRLIDARIWAGEVHQLRNIKIIVADSDPLSPPSLAAQFKAIMQPLVKNPITIDILPGGHGTDHSAFVGEQVRTAIRQGWGQLRPRG